MTRRLPGLIVKAGDDDTGTWVAVASSDRLDADGEVISARAFEPLPASVPAADGHFGGRASDVVGRARPYYQGGKLYVEGRFAATQKAQEVRRLVRDGIIDSMSIVFVAAPDGWRQVEGVRTLVRGRLVGVDFVAVGANADATVVSVRGPAPVWRARLAADRAAALLLDFDARQLELQALDRLLRDCRRTIRDWDRALSRRRGAAVRIPAPVSRVPVSRARRVPTGFNVY